MLPVIPLAAPEATRFFDRTPTYNPGVEKTVAEIYDAVAATGDEAVRGFCKQFDGEAPAEFFVAASEWDEGAAQVPQDLRDAIDRNLARIRAFHELQQTDIQLETMPGLTLGQTQVPYAKVACYVPGGRAAYPSTVLMTVTLAAIAGVQDIIVATPPGPNGAVPPAVLYAAKAAGAHRILRVGGAHGVAALAIGTQSIPRVQAIVGPGNQYVTAAKQRAGCHTDAPAGPSELLILADDTANPAYVALDLIAQAEHDPDAQVLLVTNSKALAVAVQTELETRAPNAARADIVLAALQNGAILLAENLDEALSASNRYAPEHLTIMTRAPKDLLPRITAAGSVFLGHHTPVTLGDYGSGTNHVLPTMGQAALRGGLRVDDFCTTISWQEATPDALQAIASDMTTLADAEGLYGHADAVRGRT
ncbi:MAG: histidinol dehydrogenase [Thermoplasmatota archaeon]